MTISETNLKGSFIITPSIYEDYRGYFFESFKADILKKAGINPHFVQDNESKSKKGVLRGLHYQIGEMAQAKLVRVVRGSVLDVIVDIRPESKTYGKHFKTVLSETNKQQLFIPRGFAHGFLVLEDDSIFSYKCDNYYSHAHERGIHFNDEVLDIDWSFPMDELILSDKDMTLPSFVNAEV